MPDAFWYYTNSLKRQLLINLCERKQEVFESQVNVAFISGQKHQGT